MRNKNKTAEWKLAVLMKAKGKERKKLEKENAMLLKRSYCLTKEDKLHQSSFLLSWFRIFGRGYFNIGLLAALRH